MTKFYEVHLTCSKEDKEKILTRCAQLYKKAHPQFEGVPLSQGFLINKIVEYYLK